MDSGQGMIYAPMTAFLSASPAHYVPHAEVVNNGEWIHGSGTYLVPLESLISCALYFLLQELCANQRLYEAKVRAFG